MEAFGQDYNRPDRARIRPMTKAWRHRLAGLLLWALVAAAGAGWLAHARVEQLREEPIPGRG